MQKLFMIICKMSVELAARSAGLIGLSMLRLEIADTNVALKWAPTTYQLSDILTKDCPLGDERVAFFRTVVETGEYTLGPDVRTPHDSRGRRLAQDLEEKKKELETSDALAAWSVRDALEGQEHVLW